MEQHKHFQTFPILKTKRLTLRAIQPEDAEAIFRMRASGRVNQFIPRSNMEEKTAAKELVQRTIAAYKEGNAIGWAGVLRDQQTIIGTCGFNSIDFLNKRAEIGGEMAVDYWGKGIALEAVDAILKFGFNELNLHAIEAKVSPNNKGAIHVLEHLGFQKEAHFKDRIFFNDAFMDMAVYTLFKQ